ncbi:monooxygenase [Sphaerisporangium krabiense]|uniref:2-polyprenyl-6-methoxyphenol hydroxylase-like FAD-dependent oxidoreductase n=1 Tax=Sphaerisporangium krabiense TaxID=763782 RepID=A0A7W8Z6K8_9ACTN|nr:NAD(P)/FAD-dependent oxidoreductase [Sphaerisporangium krabiense]MBB5628294.1 2-polyprenyl-6-methoxyphenol hydroxylase-like FAD-dependent oxidoreductase [Sphaerisporangium krabiense]GII66291.1 monooxygenase [Sphaerisporangium krabiense]
MHVLVIGAGLGGLCLAQRLRQDGIGVSVHERDATPIFRRQGYRLHINADGQRALRDALPSRLWRSFLDTSGRPGPRSVFLDERLGHRWTVESAEETAPLAVDRLTLRRILLTGLEDVVAFGRRCTGYAIEPGGRITARFADGTSAAGDVLVGADGVNSVIRRRLLPHAQVVDTGLRQLYGTVPLDDRTRELFTADMFNVFTAVIGPNGSFVGVAPVETPHLSYMTCGFGARPEHLPCTDADLLRMSGVDLRAMVLDLVDGWHPRIRRIVEHWDTAGLFPAVLRTSVPVDPWSTGTVTLLGDAVHAMSPAGGVGANTALRDAATLAKALRDGGPIVPALRAYETAMIDYGFAAVRRSAANGHRFLGQDPLPVS